jgi:hypothetical protein
VYEEGIGTIRHWALGGRDLCQESGILLRNLERDWAWVTAVAEPEVMFGDLHFGNAVFREPPPRLTALLFDPIPRRQPWPFEPAYFAALLSWSVRPPGRPDEARRARLAAYVTAAARLDR